MTVYLPLEKDSAFPSSPSYLQPASDPTAHLQKVVKSILKAKRIAVVCGAGISVGAGIPDFRSPDGLFQTIKRENPKEAMSSGKDLFDASVFNSGQKTSLFCQMIARLSDLSVAASPTPFHNLLRDLDNRGRLLRVYTQNIDALELKAGLTFGLPDMGEKRTRSSRLRSLHTTTPGTTSPSGQPLPDVLPEDHEEASIPHEANTNVDANIAGPSRLPSPPVEIPRCIPLHGTLQDMYCQTCHHTSPLSSHISSLSLGVPPDCPECTSIEATRAVVGKRPRGIGKLRPAVVLYNEEHRDGEGVGEVARKDLMGTGGGRGKARRPGADLLVVVGTSLRVPGTKRIVREFSKAVRARGGVASSAAGVGSPSGSGSGNAMSLGSGGNKLPTPAPSPRRSPSGASEEEDAPIKTIYLNLDFPVPTREWDGVFDVWIQGDAQRFAECVTAEIEREEREREMAVERKKRREEEVKRREEERVERERVEQMNVQLQLQTPPKSKGKVQVSVKSLVKGRKGIEKGTIKRVNIVSKGKVTPRPVNPKKKTGAKGALATPPPSAKSRGKRKAVDIAPETPPPKKRRVVLIVKPPPGHAGHAGHELKASQQQATPPKSVSVSKSRKVLGHRAASVSPSPKTRKTKASGKMKMSASAGAAKGKTQPRKTPRKTPQKTTTKSKPVSVSVSVPRLILKLPGSKSPVQQVTASMVNMKAPITPPPSYSHSHPHPHPQPHHAHGAKHHQLPEVLITIPPRHHIRRLSDSSSSLSSLTSISSSSSDRVLLTPPPSTSSNSKKDSLLDAIGAGRPHTPYQSMAMPVPIPPAPLVRVRRNNGTPATATIAPVTMTMTPPSSRNAVNHNNNHNSNSFDRGFTHNHTLSGNLQLPTRFDPVRDCVQVGRSHVDKRVGLQVGGLRGKLGLSESDADSDSDHSVLDGSLVRTLQYGFRSSRSTASSASRASSSVV